MKPFLSSIALIPGPRPHVNLIRPRFSACQPPESCRRIANTGPKRGGVSHGRCHAAGFPRHMGRLRAAAGSGSGAGRPASGLPQLGALLLRLLLQIRPFPSLAHQLGPLPEQAGSQKPVGGPGDPSLRCRAAPHPASPKPEPNPQLSILTPPPQPPLPPPMAQRRIPEPPRSARQDRPIAPVLQPDGGLGSAPPHLTHANMPLEDPSG